MPKVIYDMGGVLADGFIAGPDGRFDWSLPDEDLAREFALTWQVGGGLPFFPRDHRAGMRYRASATDTTAAVGTR
jgi:hypothetical protein